MLLLSLLLACRSAPAPSQPASPPPTASPAADAVEAPGPGALDAIERPAEIPDADVLLVAIHGRGDRPERFQRLTEGWTQVADVVVPAAPDPQGSGFSWFSIRARSDNAELAAGVAAAADRLAAFISARPQQTVVVTGFSQGGMLSFALATRHPEVIDAALPISGFLPRDLWPTALPADPPQVFALHGDADRVIPHDAAVQTVAALQALGWPVQLSVHPDVAHSISTAMHQQLDTAVRAAAAGQDPRPGG